MKTYPILFALFMLLISCNRGEDDPTLSLEIIKPLQGEVIAVDEPVEIEISVNAVDVIEEILFIANKQNIPVPDTISHQILQQTGGFNITHNHVFQQQGAVSLRIEVFTNTEVEAQAIGTVDFTVE